MARFQRRPEVLAIIGVDFAVHVGFGVVDDLVREVSDEAGIRMERIGVQLRSGLHVRAADGLHFPFPQAVEHMQPNLAVRLVVPFQERHDGDLARDGAATFHHDPALLRSVLVAGFATDEGFVGFDGAVHLPAVLALQGESQALAPASWAADDAIGPTDRLDRLAAVLVIREKQNGFAEGFGCRVRRHAPNCRQLDVA